MTHMLATVQPPTVQLPEWCNVMMLARVGALQAAAYADVDPDADSRKVSSMKRPCSREADGGKCRADLLSCQDACVQAASAHCTDHKRTVCTLMPSTPMLPMLHRISQD